MRRIVHPLVLLVLLTQSVSALEAVPEAEEDTPPRDFEVPVAENSAAGLPINLNDANTILNPFQSSTKGWPEDLVIAPIPAYSAQLGWSLTLGAGYFLDIGAKNDDVPSSIIGGFAMAAENGSSVYGGGMYLHLLEDKLRVKAGATQVDVRYRFYGIGNVADSLDIDILQKGPAYFLSGSWKVWKKLYVGLGYRSGSVDTRVRLDLAPPPFFDPVLNIDLGAFSIPIQIDNRDHEQFPRKGWLITNQNVFYRESAGSDFEAETYKLDVNHYFPMRDADVLATRLAVRSASEEVPFFLLSSFGGTTDLRGYPSGRYRDRNMYALQTEYRWQFSDRWIFTGFVGVGEVAEHFSEMGRNFLPATGIGARFVLSEKHKVGLSVDLATGNDGTEFYFGIGEAF